MRERHAVQGREGRAIRRSTGALWPRAAVFDCDGLLVDSAACWHAAYRTVAEHHGRSLVDVDVDALAGASLSGAAAHLSRELDAVVDEGQLREALLRSFAALCPPALTGAAEIVGALTSHMPLGVASNAPREVVSSVLERLGMYDAFDAVVSAEETAAHKPAPDVYLEACRRLRVAPCDAIAFEDSPLGAQAARAAGLVVIAVPFEPGVRIDADLTIPRLSDPRLLAYLRLPVTAAGSRTGG
jgi:HAD superfamily hydrolase (TIGR01509 family)